MMKIFNSIMMLVATVAAVSCAKIDQPCGLFTYKAKCPGVKVKTYLQNGSDVVWASGDAINVLTASNNEKYTLTEGSSSTTGTFSGNPVTGDAYAVYPYDASATFAEGVITTTLKATQNAKTDGFGTNINLAVAKEDEGTFAFKNVCGLIKFQIKGDNIAKVIISGNNDEYLAGKVNISFDGEGEPVCEVVEGSKTVTIQTFNGAVMTPGTYYAVVLPQTFSKGITVTCIPYAFAPGDVVKKVYKFNDLVKKGTSELVLGRASVKPVGYIDKGLAWESSVAKSILGGIRSSDVDHGHYFDFSTGRAFYALGSKDYRASMDMVMVTNGSNGLAPCSITAASAYTAPYKGEYVNLSYLGTPTADDDITNWDSRTNNWFCYVSGQDLSDAEYAAIKKTAEIKAIYDQFAGSDNANATHNYYALSDCVTNANRGRMTQAGDTDTHKYLVVKTSTTTEGVGYAIVKFLGLANSASTTGQPVKKWYIEFNYKFGLVQ